MNNSLNRFDYKIIKRNDGEYILQYRKQYFEVGALIYQILFYGKSSSSLEEIMSKIERDDLTLNKLNNIIEHTILPIFRKSGKTSQQEQTEKKYWCQTKLMSSGKVKPAVDMMRPLFGKVFWPLLVIAVLLNVAFFAILPKVEFTNGVVDVTLDVLITYSLYIVILFLHEFGHIAATLKAGLNSRCVNFGMYYVLPILYVRLDDTWTLSKEWRTKINLAGIFIELLANIPIFLMVYLSPSQSLTLMVCYTVFWMNTATLLFNLIPFLKLDGYWILSDMLNVPNLTAESNRWLRSLVVKPSPFATRTIETKGLRRMVFIGYSLLKPLFLVLFALWFMAFLVYVSAHGYFLITNMQYVQMDKEALLNFLPDMLIFLISILIVVRYLNLFIKTIRQRKK